MNDASVALACHGVSAGYEGRTVVRGADVELHDGEVLGMLGHNGAGKTTLLRAIMGSCEVTAGTVRLKDTDLGHVPTWLRAKKGLAYVPQNDRVFKGLTVAENLRDAGRQATGGDVSTRVDAALDWFPRLKTRIRLVAGSLSGGEQQMLAVAIALVRDPKVLLLDEPSFGLAPRAAEDLMESLRTICDDTGIAALVVEQSPRYLEVVAGEALLMRLGQILGRASLDADLEDLMEAY